MKKLKRNKKQRFLNWINLRYVTVIMITMILTTLIGDFNDRYILQVPIEWKGFTRDRYISPVPKTPDSKHVIDAKNPEPGIKNITPSPTPTPKRKALNVDVVRAVEASEVAIADFDKIRILESGKGTAPKGHHRYCEGLGMWNEIGYGNRNGICFDNIDEGRATLERWYTKRANEGMTLAEALCYWEGQGKGVSSCTYSQRYFAL